MLIQLNQTQWLALSMPVRMRLKEIFNIPRSQGTVVQDNVVLSDGHTHPDLARITIEAMKGFTGSSETEFFTLFEKVIEKIESEKVAQKIETRAVPKPLHEKTFKLVEVENEIKADAPLYPVQETPKTITPSPKPKRKYTKRAK